MSQLISDVLQHELRGRTIGVTAMHKHAGRFCDSDKLVIFAKNRNQSSLFTVLRIIYHVCLNPLAINA